MKVCVYVCVSGGPTVIQYLDFNKLLSIKSSETYEDPVLLPFFGNLDFGVFALFGLDHDVQVVGHLEAVRHLEQVVLVGLFVSSRTGANSKMNDLTADHFSPAISIQVLV
jgi:hypothetical protein